MQSSNLLVLQSNVAQLSTTKNLFTHHFTSDVWHNFGVILDFNEKYFHTSHPVYA